MTPAASRHGRHQNSGPSPGSVNPRASLDSPQSAYLARIWSRSISRQPNAATMNIARMPSSTAVRLITIDRPSTASSRPATQPSSVDRNSRRPMRASMTTVATPHSATAMRQPNGSMPNTSMPWPMMNLPTGGCTTNDGSFRKTSRSPFRMRSLASSVNLREYPNSSCE